MGRKRTDPLEIAQVGLLAWVLPGLGHWRLGYRGLAWVYFAAISFCYWGGIAIGGVKTSVDPRGNPWLFLAEMGVSGYTGLCFLLSSALPTHPPTQYSPYVSYYPESDIAQIYLAVAGLLNVLALLDAMARAQTGGLPVFHVEAPSAAAPAAEGAAGDLTAGARRTGSTPQIPEAQGRGQPGVPPLGAAPKGGNVR